MFPIPFNFPFRKKDGSVTTIDAAISGGGTPYTLPTASDTVKGGVKVGAGLTMDGETLKNTNPTPYTLPTASDSTKGGVKVGDGLEIDENGVLSASGGGGGGGLSYIDVTVSAAIPATSCANAPFHVSDYPALVGKTIVCGLVLEATDVYLYCVGFSRFSTPLVGDDWVYAGVYNINAAQAMVTKLRVFYM